MTKAAHIIAHMHAHTDMNHVNVLPIAVQICRNTLSYYWGEPERAPYKRYCNSHARIVYIIFWYASHAK
jgi:hypothetical protein